MSGRPPTAHGLHAEWLSRLHGQRRPLVLLHGFTGDASTWGRFVAAAPAQRPMLAVELPGHGQSAEPRGRRYSLSAAADAVVATVAEQVPLPVHWLGYSMGGRVLLTIALRHPDSIERLVLEAASPGIEAPDARADRVRSEEELAVLLERDGLAAFVERWMAHPLFASQARLGPAYQAEARAQRMRNRPSALAGVLRGMGAGAMEPLWPQLRSIRKPALLVAGALDEKYVEISGRMADQMPDARVETIPDAGHAVHVEAPEQIRVVVDAFLAGGSRPGRTSRPDGLGGTR